MTVTFAPGTTAPLVSVTFPTMVAAPVVCAKPAVADSNAKTDRTIALYIRSPQKTIQRASRSSQWMLEIILHGRAKLKGGHVNNVDPSGNFQMPSASLPRIPGAPDQLPRARLFANGLEKLIRVAMRILFTQRGLVTVPRRSRKLRGIVSSEHFA